jgi:hypothetical protein
MAKTIDTIATAALFASFKPEALAEELAARKLKPVEDVGTASMLLASGCRSLDDVTTTVINLSHGQVSGKDMTDMLAKCFPNHQIGDRHGPHYLSLVRTGDSGSKIECRFRVAKRQRVAKTEPEAKVVEVERTYDLSSLDPKHLDRIVKAVKGTPLENLIAKCLETKVEPKLEPEVKVHDQEEAAPAAK